MPSWKKVIVSGSNAVLNHITSSGNVSGSAISTASFGTYLGDGSQLDGVSAFPFTGDAQISGSLIVSQSYTAGDTDSTALRLIGSGSVSQSGIFEVEGSAGPLFSVQDGLDGVLMEVNNISGLPLFQVSSSNEVFINRGNLTSGVTTATASFASFSGSFQGDGTNLNLANNTTIPSSDPFPFTGDAQITGSLTISGSSSPLISLPNAPTDAIIISGSNDRTRLHIYESVESNSPLYTEGAGIKLVGGEGSGHQSTLEISSVGSANGGGNNEQSFIRSNQQLVIRGNDNDAGDNIRFLGSHDSYGLKFDAGSSGVTLTYFTNGGATVSELNMGNGTYIQADANGSYYKIGRSSTDWLNLSSTKATFVADVSSSSATSTASFGTYLGDGSQLTGVSAFPFTGDAQITGSLTISGSFNATTTGSSNTTIGSGSGEDLTTGVQNILVGALAGKDNTVGDGNVFIGYEAGETNTLGDYNVAMGYQAGKNLGTGTANDNNVAIGYKAGMGSGYTDANYNVFIGHQAGIDTTSGDHNIGLGFNSLFELKGGSNNIALGYQTGVNISSGTKNVMIGYEAGFKVTTGANNIFLGEGSNGTKLGGETGTSNQLRIGIDDVVTISASLSTGDVIFYNTASAPNFSGSFQGDGSQLTNLNTTTPTLQQVTTQGSSTTIPITASILSATASNAYGTTADSLTVKGGDGIHAGGTNGGNLNLQGGDSLLGASGTRKGGNVVIRGGEGVTSSGSISITGDTSITGSFTIEKSGSTVFEVIGSEGTLFSIDDDLDGVIFTANDRTGLPVLEASASGEVYIGKAPQSLYTTAVISSTTAATTQSIFGLSTSSYGGAFFDYTVQSGSDARAGSIVSVWSGSSINFTETTTLDIGDTTDFNVIVHISQSQAQIASHASRAGYNIKTIIRSI